MMRRGLEGKEFEMTHVFFVTEKSDFIFPGNTR